jgi:hypothetical protein
LRANTERGAISAPTARPNLIAQTTASRLSTGSTPGRAMSMAQAWALGAAPKAVAAPENIFDCVRSWAWVSRPMTTSQPLAGRLTDVAA